VHEDGCPNGCDLRGAPIPEESQHLWGGERFYSRLIGIEVRGVFDGILYWECPDCHAKWPRFNMGRLRDQALEYIGSQT
jgi:hypothetical protein